ncbi:GTPase domain-containing protein [Pseudomarimonas arenosa]|uniref:GTPase domain-containing protein n=1 Tax=Pseudomarimonas arenosa TaxID=2774145 RepID=A0AAW3ZJG5_9GAMM|nr:GTPase domain-containing protein [Pseudomarimonas arenosa]MBD8525590.1 GTPase domain-containing protein [Pseudomarimonas arenosa]
MSLRPFKLALLGDRNAGRSSVVSVLSGKPCPNHPGISVARWVEPGSGVCFDIWDVNSRSSLEALGQSFIAGSEAVVAVADLSRSESLIAAQHSLRAAFELLGPRPAMLLLNRRQGTVVPATPADNMPWPQFEIDAARGEGVAEAFADLARRMPST